MNKKMKMTSSLVLIAFLALSTACGGGGGGGGGSSSSGSDTGTDSGSGTDDSGTDSGTVETPSGADLDGRLLTFEISDGTTIQARYARIDGFTTDLVSGESVLISYNTLGDLSFAISQSPGGTAPLFEYDFDSVTWTTETTAELSGTLDPDAFDSDPTTEAVTASLVVSD